ncbi:HlyD family type I secretion periplasmic adaptor subunit [Aestuariivirga sp. YIM B02566]|uniref:HlyD family type I secretion periplasmic adaptor subunit n=1 Tax=Taklimakanibacter albus TaxID=2800327 RepID=A0ACC5QZ70_9HYPH|nr:HlyD family type I secretion periplasmic adaptor subunit [Aestuariivirga sp. YIM B02566]MBK1865478.1 HlyD family type I secretion periplasmic adaptor subunit [Aestuariivirga sp. YIM B02566]
MTSASTIKTLRRYQLAGFAGLGLLIGSMGLWSAMASIQGAVIATGTTVVETYLKRIQHRDGGIVADIAVKDGDWVEAGQVLVRLDETDTRAELSILQGTFDEVNAKRARLIAERDDLREVRFPATLLARVSEPRIAELLSGQRKLLSVQKAALDGRIEQLTERIGQLGQEVTGLTAQYESKREQTALVREELSNLKKLLKQGLVEASRVYALDRERARLEGEEGELVAKIAAAKGRISETKLQIIQITDDARTRSLSDLREAEAKVAETDERLTAAKAKLARMEIRAPRAGVVHQLNVHTIGGVIAPGADIMAIVPELDELVIDTQVRPEDIDQVNLGQTAQVRFPAFDQRTTPEVNGEVVQVAADLTRISADSLPFYAVRIRLGAEQIKLLGVHKLKVGMPAEAFIQTRERTPLSYFLQPLTDQIAHTFREG